MTQPPEAMGALDLADARALRDARTATHTWRTLVDRIPPGELLDVILDESAYAFELRGAPISSGAREPQKDSRPGPAHPEPRVRHPRAYCRPSGSARGR